MPGLPRLHRPDAGLLDDVAECGAAEISACEQPLGDGLDPASMFADHFHGAEKEAAQVGLDVAPQLGILGQLANDLVRLTAEGEALTQPE
jgi:hypothetical protein